MKKLIYIAAFFLLAGCQMPGDGPSGTTTEGSVPTPVANKTALISWGAATGTVQGYKIEGSGDGVKYIELGIVVGGTQTSVSITGLYSKVKYYFRVRAYNQSGNSPYTSAVTVTL